MAEALASRGEFSIIESAHMELAEPTLGQAVGKCVQAGASRIVVVPYFLAMGNHMTRDVPELVEEARAEHSGIEISLAEPLGLDERMINIVLDRAKAALGD